MKFFSLLAIVAVAQAQDEEAAEGEAAVVAELESGAPCLDAPSTCAAGLCCAEGIFKEDVIEGEVADSYLDNLITVCTPSKESEYTSDDGEEFWMTCLKIDTGATYVAAGIAAIATSTLMMA